MLAETTPTNDDEYEECYIEAQNAFCSLGRKGKYSSNMLVFGFEQPLPGSLLDFNAEQDLPLHSQVLTDHILEKKILIRSAARKHALALESDENIRLALLARPRPYPGPYYQGDEVLVWRRQLQHGKKTGEPTWDGPGVVVVDSDMNTAWVEMDTGQQMQCQRQ